MSAANAGIVEIVMMNDYFGTRWSSAFHLPFDERTRTLRLQCPQSFCVFHELLQRESWERAFKYPSAARALFFHVPSIVREQAWYNSSDIPPDIKTIGFTLEPPGGYKSWRTAESVDVDIRFNLTFSYSRTGTIRVLPGQVRPRLASQPPAVFNYADFARKTRDLVWMSSNCDATGYDRMGLVEELDDFIPIDIYGWCGNLSCHKSEHGKCMRMIERTYKFMVVFENSLCRGYVSEKIFNVLKLGIIPVVIDRREIEGAGVPGSSFIALDDFGSIQELALYMKYVSMTYRVYASFFDWKRGYGIVSSTAPYFCQLCDHLHLNRNVAEDSHVIFNQSRECRAEFSFPLPDS